MAREPYRSRMLRALLSVPADDQPALLREFVVQEAGSSHSDVVASDTLQTIVERFVPGRTGWPDPDARDPVPPGAAPKPPWWSYTEDPWARDVYEGLDEMERTMLRWAIERLNEHDLVVTPRRALVQPAAITSDDVTTGTGP
jgi:hypothetical protein